MNMFAMSSKVFIILFILQNSSLALGIRCGPSRQCSCVKADSVGFINMDCSSVNVSLKDTCNFTRNNPNITTLEFNNNETPTVKQGDLLGCEGITELYLRNSSIHQIDDNTFSIMTGLQLLDISSNKLDVYRQHIGFLQELEHLKELRINGNWEEGGVRNQSHYPNLDDLPELETLFMDGLFNVELDYSNLMRLGHLRLSGWYAHCNLGDLTNGTFELVPHLTHLDVSNCNITNIYAGTFSGLRQLVWLDVSFNMRLGFAPLRNISYSLQFTRIEFLNLTKLHTTFERCSRLTHRDMCYFRNTTLREIIFDSNKIEMVERNIALLMPDTLQVVRARDNPFTFGLYLLQWACLSNLTTFDCAFQNNPHSPLLYLTEPDQKQPLTVYPSGECIFDDPAYLRNISKKTPSCRFFESDTISKSDLYQASFPKYAKSLAIHDSNLHFKIKTYPVVPFDNDVEYIDFSGNVFFEWLGPIGPFPKLKTANGSRNYCNKIDPNFFFYTRSLQNLHIQNNYLGIQLSSNVNGSTFMYLKNLEFLDLSSNQIGHLPPYVFKYLLNLRSLNLSINSINEWKISSDTLPKLQYLDVRANALSELPQTLTSHFDDLAKRRRKSFAICMKDNPIGCSCKQKYFLEWMIRNKRSFIDYNQYEFKDESGKALTVDECEEIIGEFDKTCRSYTLLIILCSAGITLFLSCIVFGLIYKNRWKLRYFLFMNKRRFFGLNSDPNYEPIENFKYDAFISYAQEDHLFIRYGIRPNLKDEMNLCIHELDFIAGNAVTDNIINAIQNSRKTVVILSQAFLKSKWCLYEFHMARLESIYSRENCLIMVMLENMAPNKLMPLEMIEWIKRKSYIEYTEDEEGNQLFWENLKQAIMQ